MFPSSNSMNVVAGEMNVQTSSINSMILQIDIYIYNNIIHLEYLYLECAKMTKNAD